MALFQRSPGTPDEVNQSRPLDLLPEAVAGLEERQWYARAFRGDAAQLTWRAVLLGNLLGFLLALTNVYVGLKTGWAIGVALTACIVSFTVWTGLVKIGVARTPMTILEINCTQSTASAAGYATAAITSTAVPAMLLLSTTDKDPRGHNLPWQVVAPWVLLVAVLGVLMAIPMKRRMINRDRLAFPSGTAAAVLLRSLYTESREAVAKGRALLWAGLVGVLVPLLKDLNLRHGAGLVPGQSRVFDWLPARQVSLLDAKTHELVERWTRSSEWGMTLDHGVVLLGAGAIVGLRTTFAMLLGAMCVVYALGPIALGWSWTNAAGAVVAAARSPASAWKDIGIWFGAPLLVAYGLVAFALQFRRAGRALTSLRGASTDDADERVRDAEVPLRWFVVGTAICGTALVVVARAFFAIPLHYGALSLVMSFVLALVAARAAGETDVNPGGPMGKIVQLAFGVLMPQSYAANLMTASITVGGGIACSDLLNDLKAGYLLGAHPRRQFVAQLLGLFTGTIATCIGYYALVPDATVLTGTPDRPAEFPVPGAQQWRVVAELFKLGMGNLHPMARDGIAVGLLAGTLLAVTEWALPRHRRWVPSPTGLGLGLLLPFYVPLSFFVGAAMAWVFGAANKKQADRFVVPIASGLIAGESIVGVIVQVLNSRILS
ncbi:MAG: OPT/YSL family transporter [Polyangiaceae bacterium]|jgi:uncharacterized oligopeptide transporter (OPT) family protein